MGSFREQYGSYLWALTSEGGRKNICVIIPLDRPFKIFILEDATRICNFPSKQIFTILGFNLIKM